MRFFKVIAKCGHVGKNYYYRGTFYVKAKDGKSAALMVRVKPRVKTDHKDAILDVIRIGIDEYKEGKLLFYNNPYFKCYNIQDQRRILAQIKQDIFHETNKKMKNEGKEDRLARLKIMRDIERKANKYGICEAI